MSIEALVALFALGAVIFSSQLREAYARASASTSDDTFKTIKTYSVKFLTSVWFWGLVLIIWLFGFDGFTKLITDPWRFGDERVTAVQDALSRDNPKELVSVQGGTIRYEYMLDFSQPTLARAKLRVSDYTVCEHGLRLYEAGNTAEARTYGVFEDGYAAPDGTVVLTSALICEYGPDSRDTVIWRGDEERVAYELFWRQREQAGVACPSNLRPEQGCYLIPAGRSFILPNMEAGKCLRFSGVDPNGSAFTVDYNIGKAGYPADNEWVTPAQWMNILKPPVQKPVKEVRFNPTSLRQTAVIYEYRIGADSCYQ